ncbi:hypothetical protein [Mucilaginibacter sp.]|uniref:hypothetical protein n=1 Tax=Mucilaginibacter sp. TaxID=1882438 RepID=UPI003B0047BC
MGFVSQPYPFGAFTPEECLTYLLTEVLAAIFFFSDGVLNPNFIVVSLVVLSKNGGQRKRLGEELEFETRQPKPKLNL